MNKIFSKLAIRNIKSNIKQFLSVIVIVLLATMLISGFIVNNSTLDNSISRYFADTNLADMWVYVDGVSEEDEEFFKSNNIDYAKRFYTETTAKIPASNSQNNAKIYVGNGKISNPIIESGKKGCLIDKNVASNNGIRSGNDEITFSIKFSTAQGDFTLELKHRITGTMSFDECADTYSSWPVFIDEEVFVLMLNNAIEENGLSGLFSIENVDSIYNQILIKTDDFQATEKLITDYYETSQTNLFYVFSRESIESVVLLNGEIEQSKKMIYVFPVIFLIVSVLVILTTLDQLIIQEKTKIGTLKSIGISDKKILWHYTMYGTILCMIGCIIGIILGIIIIPNVMFVKYHLVYSIPESYVKINVPVLIILAEFVSIVLLGFFVSFFACFGILHKKPVDCLRFDIGFGSKKLKMSSEKLKKVPLSMKMAFRNIRLKPIRTLMASVGIAGCVALLLCGLGINDTLNFSSSNDLNNVFSYDITTTYTNTGFEDNLKLNFSEIDFYEKYEKYYGEVISESKHKNYSIFEIVQNSSLSSIKLVDDEVCLSNSVAKELGVKVGDKVKVLVGGKQTELEVTGLVETSFFNGIYVCRNLGFDTALATHGMWIKCNEIKNSTVSELNKINGTNTAYSKADLKANVDNKISSIGIMTTTLETFAILLAIVVLLNLIFLVLKERVREIATLKVLGMNIFSIGISMFFEILFMSIFGTIVGLLLGYPLLVLVLSINKVEVMNFLYHIMPISYVVAILIIFATIVIVSALCVIKIKKINMIESLKSVE